MKHKITKIILFIAILFSTTRISVADDFKIQDNAINALKVKSINQLKKSIMLSVNKDADFTRSEVDLPAMNLITTKPQTINVRYGIHTDTGAFYMGTTNVSFSFETEDNNPLVLLKQEAASLNLGDTFQYTDNILSVVTTDGLPYSVLSEKDNVDTTKEGSYRVDLKIADFSHNISSVSWSVNVTQSLDAIKNERQKAIQQEKAKKLTSEAVNLINTGNTDTSISNIYSDAKNPYPGSWDNCTWGAWECYYQYRGVALVGMGDAGNWYGIAKSLGYATGTEPANGAIGVFSHHVVYVLAVLDDKNMIIEEGNYNGHHNVRTFSINSTDAGNFIGFIY